ncbi:MAG: tetratricopeptide repeat protein, partial [Terriglobia bacterium]
PVGLTGADGNLSFTGVSPSAHYVHVDCKGGPEETYFISPHAGSTLKLSASGQRSPTAAQPSPLAAAEQTTEVRSLFHEAAEFRSNSQFPETIGVLRRAIEIDPGNPNLHHELATTFLMIRDWEGARVELLETIRHDPNSAGLHNDLGYALEKLGEIRAALDEFRLATKLDPADTSYRDQYFEALGLLAAQQPGKKKRQRNR